jgi:vacuolar protein sorting-associated protein 29
MVLVLVLGDLHIPYRAGGIPEAFRKMFVPGRINKVFLTGNATSAEVITYLKTFCSDVQCTAGDMDDYDSTLPEMITAEVGDLKFGMLHGHQVVPWGDKEALAMTQRKLDVDVLISGHTHSQKHFELDGKLFVNPGSITGAFSTVECDVTPSFILMDVQGTSITSYVYAWDGAELKVKKKMYAKA